ncbi:MAG: HlyD family efflux transporter periplasmic adaptor subunit [Acidobacteria bacterium]|nr:HlyD family efflux transporter periplasmic adaptor subunit [Acidobacteriota bacterium]
MTAPVKAWLFRLYVVVVLLASLGGAGYYFRDVIPAAAKGPELPTAIAKQGEFLVVVSCRGELVSGRSRQVVAPLNVPDLRIAWQATPGSLVKEGDPLIRFDASGAKRQLQEKEAAFGQSNAALAQATAQVRIQEEQDRLNLAWQKHTVERARLEVAKAEIESAMKGEESRIDLTLAEEKLKVQQAALELNKTSGTSRVASVTSQNNKNETEVNITNRRISQMEVKSPSDGVVEYAMNYSQGWMNARPFKIGDNVWPGSTVAEIPDLTSLRMKAKVEEIERGRIQAGMAVKLRLDPFPESQFPGKLASISPLTEQNFEWPPSRNFRAYGQFEKIDPRLRPGMNGRLDVIVDRIPDAISIPAKAIFSREGRPMVLLVTDAGTRSVGVSIVARNPDEVAVKGIAAGAKVALIEEQTKTGGKKK